MQKVVPAGVLLSVGALYVLRVIDPQNPIFELLTLNQGTALVHSFLVGLACTLSIKESFRNTVVACAAGIAGLLLLTASCVALFSSVFSAYVEPLDAMLGMEGGIMLLIAAFAPSEEAEHVYQATPSIATERFKFTFPKAQLRPHIRRLA